MALTMENFIFRIKEMSDRERQKVTADELVRIILQIPDGTILLNRDEKVASLEETVAKLATTIELVRKQSVENTAEIRTVKDSTISLTNRTTTNEEAIENILNDDNIESLEKELFKVKSDINNIEQYLRINNIEVVGLPLVDDPNDRERDAKNEKLLVDTLNTLDGLDRQLTVEDIDISHPVPSNRRDNKTVFIARLISRKRKNEIISAKKSQANHNFKFRNRDIFINEHLSPENRTLFAQASERKRLLNYKFLWTKNGVTHLRKEENSAIITIKCEKDLENLRREQSTSIHRTHYVDVGAFVEVFSQLRL